MKRISSIGVFFLMLGVATAQQPTNNSTATNDELVPSQRAVADDSTAQFNRGNFYFKATNYVEAVKWYQKSAEQGFAEAQAQLGICYQNGFGIPENSEQAVKWFNRAAMQGDKGGQTMLGLSYYSGLGVPINDVEAYKWLSLATSHEWGESDFLRKIVGEALKVCQDRMSRAEIAEAQQLAREFKPHKEISSSPILSNQPAASGTGFFITDDGYLISNFHVVKGATKVQLRTGAGLIPVKVVRTDAANDIALLKADGRFPSLPIATSKSAGLGNSIFTLGFPNPGLQGFAPKLAKGEIASLSGAADDARYFQISVPLQPGNSGGALVDEHGNVIGIVSAKLDASLALASSGALPENVNYAIKSSFLLSFLESAPDVSAKLKSPNTAEEKFSDAVKQAQDATVLVLVY